MVGFLRQPDQIQQFPRPSLGLSPRHAFEFDRPQRQVVDHRQVREQVERLEHHVHRSAHLIDVRARIKKIDAVDMDRATAGGFQTIEAAQHCAFSGAGGADDRHHFPGVNFGRHVGEHGQVAVSFGQVFDPDHAVRPLWRRRCGSVRRSSRLIACNSAQAIRKYSAAASSKGKNASKVRLRMMSLALVRSCTAM